MQIDLVVNGTNEFHARTRERVIPRWTIEHGDPPSPFSSSLTAFLFITVHEIVIVVGLIE